MLSPRTSRLLAALTLAAGAASPAAAQHVALSGRGEPELDRRLSDLLASPDVVIATADTLIARGDTVPGPLLVIDATLRLEGVVAGDLVGVGANLFLRPSARIDGDVVNIAGGLYPSSLMSRGGEEIDAALAPYHVERDPPRVLIVGEASEPSLRLPGVAGFEPPTYDRVDGLGLDWGVEYALPPIGLFEPLLQGRVRYRSERGELQGGGRLVLVHPAARFTLGAEERTATNEAWIRGDTKNTLSYLFLGKDYRDYHEATRIWAEVARPLAGPGWTGEARLRAQREAARSLRADDPWTVLEDDFRPNPAIDEGEIVGAVAEAELEWVGQWSAFEGGVSFEGALEGPIGGDFGFGRFQAWGEWQMAALRDHTLEIEWMLAGPLPGTDELPRQRWTFVGGSGTLNTFELAQFRGDRVAYVETDYVVPLPRRWRLPLLGAPDLIVLHRVGRAWSRSDSAELQQNIGLRLQFFSLYVRLMTNPEEAADDVELDVGLSWPFDGGRPWQ